MKSNLETSSDEIIWVILFCLFWLTLELFGWILAIIILIIITIFTIVVFLQWFLPKKIDSYIEELSIKLDDLSTRSFEEIDNISDILESIETARNIIWKAKILRYIGYVWKSQKIKITTDWYAYYIEYTILNTLYHLQKRLWGKIEQQQSTLESAKFEVEKNIAWTTELNQISELQRARLDRQIEQFEELQRILVKV